MSFYNICISCACSIWFLALVCWRLTILCAVNRLCISSLQLKHLQPIRSQSVPLLARSDARAWLRDRPRVMAAANHSLPLRKIPRPIIPHQLPRPPQCLPSHLCSRALPRRRLLSIPSLVMPRYHHPRLHQHRHRHTPSPASSSFSVFWCSPTPSTALTPCREATPAPQGHVENAHRVGCCPLPPQRRAAASPIPNPQLLHIQAYGWATTLLRLSTDSLETSNQQVYPQSTNLDVFALITGVHA
jgi:hypothetical protein